jgi:hypothetical protein
MAMIVTVPDFDAAATAIARMLLTSETRTRIVRLEGFCGAGRTNIGSRLSTKIGAVHIAVDKYASKFDEPPPYPQCIKQTKLDVAIAEVLASGQTCILDAICLEEVAPRNKWGLGFVIYVKQLSFNNPDPIWHDGLTLDDPPPQIEPHRSGHIYHMQAQPHMTADMIVELPQEGHFLPSGSFSHEMCFDPPASVRFRA